VIGRLRRVFSSALGRGNAPAAELSDSGGPTRRGVVEEPAQRIEAARRRLKATIPPPED
jgi:hypothetical protein